MAKFKESKTKAIFIRKQKKKEQQKEEKHAYQEHAASCIIKRANDNNV